MLKIQHHEQHPDPIKIDGMEYHIQKEDLELALKVGNYKISFNKRVKIDRYENDPELKDHYEAYVQDINIRSFDKDGKVIKDWTTEWVDEDVFEYEFSIHENETTEIGFYTEVLT